MRKTVKNRFAVLMLALTLIITSLSWEPMQVNAAEVPEQQIDSVSDGDENPTEEPAEVPAEESEELLEEETALPEDEPLDLDYILGRPMTEEEIAEQYAIAAQCMEHNGWVKPDMSQRPTRRATGRNVKSGSYTFAASYRNTNLPAVRNQNPYGSCWAFSAIACLEANMIKKGLANTSIDLSERHLIYYGNYSAKDPLGNDGGDSLYFNSSNYTDVLNAGGNNYLSRNALMNWKGAVPESAAPYSAVTTPLNQNDMNLAYGQDTVYMKVLEGN